MMEREAEYPLEGLELTSATELREVPEEERDDLHYLTLQIVLDPASLSLYVVWGLRRAYTLPGGQTPQR